MFVVVNKLFVSPENCAVFERPTPPLCVRGCRDLGHRSGLFSVTTEIDSLSDRVVAGLQYAEL